MSDLKVKALENLDQADDYVLLVATGAGEDQELSVQVSTSIATAVKLVEQLFDEFPKIPDYIVEHFDQDGYREKDQEK